MGHQWNLLVVGPLFWEYRNSGIPLGVYYLAVFEWLFDVYSVDIVLFGNDSATALTKCIIVPAGLPSSLSIFVHFSHWQYCVLSSWLTEITSEFGDLLKKETIKRKFFS